MRGGRSWIFGSLLLLATLLPWASRAQDVAPEALAAAKELIATMHIPDQLAGLMPGILKGLKPDVVQGRPDVERQYDIIAPKLAEGFVFDFVNAVATIWANDFSTEDMQERSAFYKTPDGQRELQQTPAWTLQTELFGRKIGESVAEHLRSRIIDELRRSGVNL